MNTQPTLAAMPSLPYWPRNLQNFLIGARVSLVFVVNRSGAVEDVHVVDVTVIDYSYLAPEEYKTSESRRQAIAKEFGDSAVAFAKQLRYQPALKYSAATKKLGPVAVRMPYTVNLHARTPR